MFKVNAIITMKFKLDGLFKSDIIEEINSLKNRNKVLSENDNGYGWITLVVKEPLEFDSYRDFIFDIDKRLEEYEEDITGANIKSVTFEDKRLIMNEYL